MSQNGDRHGSDSKHIREQWTLRRRRLLSELLAMERSELYRMLGFDTVADYARHTLGYSRADVEEFLEVARALESLPKTAAAFDAGTIPWRVLRALARVATRRNEAVWLERAQRMSSADLVALTHRRAVLARSRRG